MILLNNKINGAKKFEVNLKLLWNIPLSYAKLKM